MVLTRNLKFQKEINLFGGKNTTYIYCFGRSPAVFVGPMVAAAVRISWPSLIPDHMFSLSKCQQNFRKFVTDTSFSMVSADEINTIGMKTAERKASLAVISKIRRGRLDAETLVAFFYPGKYWNKNFFLPTFNSEFIGTAYAMEVAKEEYHEYMKTATIKNEIRNVAAKHFL